MKRMTKQRRAIWEVFTENPRPLRVEEVLALAQAKTPTLGIATVYRNVRRFVDDGKLSEVALPEIGMLYERADIGHHHHFFCRRCGRLYDFPGCPLREDDLAPRGYAIEAHELFLYGVCAACREA
jgi:Fur family transcriptional regulator, ferric uptake regulator